MRMFRPHYLLVSTALFGIVAVQVFSLSSHPNISKKFGKTIQMTSTFLLASTLENDDGKRGDSSLSRADDKRPLVNQATIQFNNKLNKMARNFDKNSGRQVEDLLRKTLKDVQMGIEMEIQPNVVTFTAAINAWARSQQPDAAERAEDILDWMVALSDAADPASLSPPSVEDQELADMLFLKPNCIAYNAAITAWIRSPSKDSHNEAERIMNKLWDHYVKSYDPDLKPNARTFNLVINAIARSREPKCADRAAALLNRMEDLYTAGDEDMEPDAQTFGAIINAYANDSSDPQSSDKAAQMLQQMNSMYQLGYESVKPNTFVYNACMNAFAKSEGHDNQAAELLEMMEQQYQKGDHSVKPDVVSYSTCINAYANARKVDSGTRADAILQRMTNLYLLDETKGVKPNAFTYTSTIKAWVASASVVTPQSDSVILQRAAERADQILTCMCLQYLSGDEKQKPTKATFDLVYDAMKGVQDSEGMQRIEKMRKRILSHNLARREAV